MDCRPLWLMLCALVLSVAGDGYAQAVPPASSASPTQPPSRPLATTPNFRATSVVHDPSGRTMRSQVYVDNGRIRIDPQNTSAAQGYMLLDARQRAATLVNPSQGYFVRETPQVAWQTLQSFTPGTSPCPPGTPPTGASCRDVGPQMVNGRDTELWQISQSIQGQPTLTRIWVDRRLGVPIKWENSNGGRTDFSGQLQNIQEGPQPASLFAFPQGLRDATPPPRTQQYGSPQYGSPQYGTAR